jgi:hypothetical protein
MTITISKSRDVLKWSIRLAVVGLAIAPSGCSPEGTGTIKVDRPESVRARLPGGGAESKVDPAKKRALLETQQETKKHAKLD